jgi:hemoglobin-like flavoprotein
MESSLTPQQKELVQRSFRTIIPRSSSFTQTFYSQLFALRPEVKPLFHGDIRLQGEKLMEILMLAVSSLDLPNTASPAMSALGRRHVGYGVKREYFDTLGVALIAALRIELGDQFTPEVEEAWGKVYQLLATMAVNAAYPDS